MPRTPSRTFFADLHATSFAGRGSLLPVPMDALLIALAFLLGLVARSLGLPPLVGFLVAGFVLQGFGVQGGDELAAMADLGVTLLLFSIGLKLRVRTLARAEIWGGTSLHTTLVVLLFTPLLFGVSTLVSRGAGMEWSTALLLSFALSFSSTVFAVKSLTESGELGAMHGRVAIGILITQDVFAVLFITFAEGKFPSPWMLALIPLLLVARPLLGWLLGRSGHGELITLCGLFLALVVGAESFGLVGLKADLGALFVGVLVGWHPRAKELSKSLLGLTDLLLVGFFLQIGLVSSLTWQTVCWALLMLVLLPVKSLAFFGILTRFRLRARTAWMSALSLSTYSEFGLIVMSLGIAQGLIGPEWLAAVALALSFSFLLVAPLTRRAEVLYDPISSPLRMFETKGRHPDDLPIRRKDERVAIFGMGRVGTAAYGYFETRFPGRIIGFDRDPAAVAVHQEAERNVLLADATDSDFWERVRPRDDIDLVVLAMPKHSANVSAVETLRRHDFQGVVVTTGKFDDEVRELRGLGVDTAFNLYSQAGTGFAAHAFNVFRQQRPDLASAWRADED